MENKQLSIEQLECKFAPDFLKLPISKTGKNSEIKNIRTDTIPDLYIRIQVRYDQSIHIQTFIQYMLCIFRQMAQQQKRSLISEMGTEIFA